MAHHKRRRPRAQRAGCYCGGKANKKLGRRATRGGTANRGDFSIARGPKILGYSRGSELRLRVRAADDFPWGERS